MVLLAHILIALASLTAATAVSLAPARLGRTGLRLSYGLIGLTLASGTYLVIAAQAPLLRSCLTGLAYSLLATGLVTAARRRLAASAVASGQTSRDL